MRNFIHIHDSRFADSPQRQNWLLLGRVCELLNFPKGYQLSYARESPEKSMKIVMSWHILFFYLIKPWQGWRMAESNLWASLWFFFSSGLIKMNLSVLWAMLTLLIAASETTDSTNLASRNWWERSRHPLAHSILIKCKWKMNEQESSGCVIKLMEWWTLRHKISILLETQTTVLERTLCQGKSSNFCRLTFFIYTLCPERWYYTRT